MNNKRRKCIKLIVGRLKDVLVELEEIHTEEQESFENIPENLMNSERYQQSETAVDTLDDVKSSIEDHISELEEII